MCRFALDYVLNQTRMYNSTCRGACEALQQTFDSLVALISLDRGVGRRGQARFSLRTSVDFDVSSGGGHLAALDAVDQRSGVADHTEAMHYSTDEGELIPVAGAFLRQFDQCTGKQQLENGRPVLLKSPAPGFAIAIVQHADGTTHGIVSIMCIDG